jgi:hypothetical protein
MHANGSEIPRRQRASKVQSHVPEVVNKGHRFNMPTELEALGGKQANTLATSLEAVTRLKLAPVLRHSAATGASSSHKRETHPDTWVVHILVGDAGPTNEAAAKLLLLMCHQLPFWPVRGVLLAGPEMLHAPGPG